MRVKAIVVWSFMIGLTLQGVEAGYAFNPNTVHLSILMHFSNSIRSLQTTFLGRS